MAGQAEASQLRKMRLRVCGLAESTEPSLLDLCNEKKSHTGLRAQFQVSKRAAHLCCKLDIIQNLACQSLIFVLSDPSTAFRRIRLSFWSNSVYF